MFSSIFWLVNNNMIISVAFLYLKDIVKGHVVTVGVDR